MIELTALVVLGVIVFAVLSFALLLLKAVVWLLFLPFRLLFGVILLPFLILKVVIGGLLLLVIGPVFLLALFAGVVGLIVAVYAPLLPLLFVGAAVYFLFKLTERPAVAR